MANALKKPSRKPTWATVRDLALAQPGVEESTSYRTPAMKLRGKPIARLKEDGESIVVPVPMADRDVRVAAEPDVFFVTDHCVPYAASRPVNAMLFADVGVAVEPRRLPSAR
jgi:hypothetical protein